MATTVEGSQALEDPTGTAPDPGGRRVRQFAYYPGCIAEFSSKELDKTTQALAPMLDIELLPLPGGWSLASSRLQERARRGGPVGAPALGFLFALWF